ncbi:unnamed protein product [Rotaria sp. Silwood2]|nr:unnamed protein product [Rotaria sp. Silwood2]
MLSVDHNTNLPNKDDGICLYRSSKYLKMSRKFLLHSLHLHLNYKFKRKKEQQFILSRLDIFDQQFCLYQICRLYQTYFDLDLQYQMWPLSLTIVVSMQIMTLITYFQG